jgi:hypothetical protein
MQPSPAVTIVAAMQMLAPSPRQLAHVPRPLQPAEIAIVLSGTREASAGKTFTLSFPDRVEGPQILMHGDGRPARMRTVYGISGGSVGGNGTHTEWHDDFIDLVDYTATAAKRCDGSPVTGELVITYQHRASTDAWTARAATTAVDLNGLPSQIGAPIFNILSGTTPVSSDVVRETDGHLARALTAPFSPPGNYGSGDSAAKPTESLWIDVDSLLPVKWEVMLEGRVGYELVFTYAPLDLRPPEGVEAPRCIP